MIQGYSGWGEMDWICCEMDISWFNRIQEVRNHEREISWNILRSSQEDIVTVPSSGCLNMNMDTSGCNAASCSPARREYLSCYVGPGKILRNRPPLPAHSDALRPCYPHRSPGRLSSAHNLRSTKSLGNRKPGHLLLFFLPNHLCRLQHTSWKAIQKLDVAGL